MSIEETKTTCEVRSTRELNLYLQSGWKLVLTYVRQLSDSQEPRFVLAWQDESQPVVPETLDEWELSEIDRQRHR
ncbi:MAG: hypothetical protein LC734_03215 [Acidobacteria bacterium]|nr:hypothetical protein [Acidobacteriota bacterium]